MLPFDVYPLFDVTPVRGEGAWIWDEQGQKYLDFYGGHAVISIGHSHPHFVQRIEQQLSRLGFYSNSVKNPLQIELAQKLGQLSGYEDYALFLCNSGAEAIENALKVASFHNQRKKILTFERAFHGRTSAAVALTDNPKIQAAVNPADHVLRIPFDDQQALDDALEGKDVCAVVVEGIQGVGGIHMLQNPFLQYVEKKCRATGTLLILDEIQSGYGRSGKFFAHQHAAVQPDIITVAKGMGNGFPIGGILIHPQFEPWYGMLGTTFGGNHLACAAGLAVLEVIEQEDLMAYAQRKGDMLKGELTSLPYVKEVRGEGLMLGLELKGPAKPIRTRLVYDHHIFTGSSSQPHVLRLLPPLNVGQEGIDMLLTALQGTLSQALISA
ncbi:MAG: aminotransferase class III-fold pyridoxal phosphate-dependent enzyme [Bacteroidota bacterium]